MSTATPVDSQTILNIRWQRIRPMPGQPREYFNQGELKDLATSIAAVGQRVPAQVARVEGDDRHDFELIDGQRRWHAVQLAGKRYLRCEVVDEPDEDRRYVLSVVANMARMGYHPMEIAVACDRMRRVRDPDTGKPTTLARVSEILGRSISYVDNHLLLLRLNPDIQKLIHPSVPKSRRLPYSAAILLAKLEPGEQAAALEKIRARGTSPLRATRQVVQEMPVSTKNKRGRPYDRYRSLQRTLRRVAEDLGLYTRERFGSLTMSREPEEIRSLRQRLELIRETADWMLRELPGG